MQINDQFRHPRYGLCHVRGFIDEQVVFRWWRRKFQDWEYDCEPRDLLTKNVEFEPTIRELS